MEFKKSMIIIILTIFLFSIASVCAGDANETAIASDDANQMELSSNNEITENNQKTSEDDSILAQSNDDENMGAGTASEILCADEPAADDFNALNETVNGNQSKNYIELEKDYHGSFDGGNGIQINREYVVIDGKGHTIDCTGENSRMFNVCVDGIVFKNIVFSGGRFDCGGAIYTNKCLTVINCTFIDNQATGWEYGGGAIFADDIEMSIYNCTFINNHATSNGGAIASSGDAPDDWEIFGCIFIDNLADDNGGALYSHANSNMGSIVNSTFIGNRAGAGDAVYNYGYYGTIDRCIFVNNTANSMICGPYAEMTVSNSIIVNNYGDNLINVETPVIDYNWWGTTADDEEAPVVSGETLDNYYILNMTVDDDSAEITLNNLYDHGVIISSYDKYALPSINFTLKGRDVEVPDSVALGADGETTLEYAPAGAYEITVCYNGVELAREIKTSFKLLNDKINFQGSEISLKQDCIYNSAKDSSLTRGIEFGKDMCIDGEGHIIDAMGLSNIIYFDDDTYSYSLTLKNIVFANATGMNGAAVYFRGNKIEIINCTFTNNNAAYEGDAVYVANAVSNANKISQSAFTENTGSNSAVYVNLDSGANLKVDNSIFMKNAAAKDITATGNVIAEHNWWGNTDKNNENISKTEGVDVINWLFLKIDAVPAINGVATISLNNAYDGSEIGSYEEYALPPITFALGGSDCRVPVPEITLGDDGQANYQFGMDRATATLTASYGDVTATRQLEYHISDDGSFRALNEIIFFTDDGDVVELTHDYVYSDNDTITDGIVIPRKITINGNGHSIDAQAKSRIFYVPEGVCHVSVNNITFVNAKASYGSVIVISQHSDYFTFTNCNFKDNAATDYGGMMDCVGDYCNIDSCNFENNSAVSKAGAIRYYHNNQAYIKNSNFIANRVADGSDGGGAIYADDGAVNIDKSLFINNSANDRPGSVLFTIKSATISNSIFLNNPGNCTVYGPGVEIADSWFGNNATDYATLPNTTNAKVKTCLFLNASVEAISIPESWPADISFTLYSFNATSGKISEYDNDFFDNIEFAITASNGHSDKNTVNLKEVFSYTPSLPGNGYVTAAVENVFCTIEFDIHERKDPHFSFESSNITYGSNAVVLLNYNASATGKVNITLKGRNNNYSFYDMDLSDMIVLEGILNSDKYDVTVTYSGDGVFSNASANSTFAVDKASSDLTIYPSSPADYGNDVYVYYQFENATGIAVNLSSGNEEIATANIEKYGDHIVVCNLGAGEYALKITTEVDDNHYSISKTANITVNKVKSTISLPEIELDYGKSRNVTVTAEGATGITAKINDEYLNVINNYTIQISALNAGNYTLTLTAIADANHTNVSKTVNITVNKVDSTLTVSNIVFDYGSSGSADISFTGAAGINVSVINQPDAIVIVKNNTVTVSSLDAGTYNMAVTTIPDSNHNAVIRNATVTVNKLKTQITAGAVTATYNINKDLVITLKDANGNPLTGVKVTVNLNGAKTYATDKNGQVKVASKGLAAKTYTAKITFNGNTNYDKSTKDVKVTVKKATLKMTAKKKTFKAKTKTKKYTITLKDNAGKAIKKVKVTLKVKGKTYKTTTNSKGKATFKIKNLKKKGKYTAVIKYKGNKNYNKVTKKVKLTVKANKK